MTDYEIVNSPEFLSKIRLRGNLWQRSLDTPIGQVKRRFDPRFSPRRGRIEVSEDRQRLIATWNRIGWDNVRHEMGGGMVMHWGQLAIVVPRGNVNVAFEGEKLRDGEREGTPSVHTWEGYDDVWHTIFRGKNASPWVDRESKPPVPIPDDTLCAAVVLAWEGGSNRRTDFAPLRYRAVGSVEPIVEPPEKPPGHEDCVPKAEHEAALEDLAIGLTELKKKAIAAQRREDADSIADIRDRFKANVLDPFKRLSFFGKIQRANGLVRDAEVYGRELDALITRMKANE